jgi:hypothetical protein
LAGLTRKIAAENELTFRSLNVVDDFIHGIVDFNTEFEWIAEAGTYDFSNETGLSIHHCGNINIRPNFYIINTSECKE